MCQEESEKLGQGKPRQLREETAVPLEPRWFKLWVHLHAGFLFQKILGMYFLFLTIFLVIFFLVPLL